jgi:thiol-disulfide isomerase/thioredoxin
MPSRLQQMLPTGTGVLGALAVLAVALALLVTRPEFDALLPAPTAPGLASPTPTTSPSEGPSSSPSASSSETVGLQPGQLAPPLEVDNLAGGTIDLASLRGHAVWLNFMGSWCPPCYDELPTMERYWLRAKDKGLVVVGVDVKEGADEARALVKQTGVTFPVGVDPTSTTEQFWSVYAMPVHFWIDAAGYVRSFAFGGIGPQQMEAGLNTVLPEVFPTPAPSAAVPSVGPGPTP